MLDRAGVTTITGHARLIDAHTVAVGDQRFEAERIMIATGGHPVRPDIPGAELGISSDEALDLTQRPERVMIVGGGYIGVEFAGIFGTAGSTVTQVLRQDLPLRGFDQELRVLLHQAMVARGVAFRPRTLPTAITKQADGLAVSLSDGTSLVVDQLLWATGRRPNTANLGLEAAGVAMTDAGAIAVDGWSRTSVPSIYAVGDVTDRVALTPVAIAEGRAVAETLFNKNATMVQHDTIATAVFSRPELATVGLSEEAARARYGAIKVFATAFRPMPYILAGREERTLMKLIVDAASDRVLGAHMLGPDAAEIIQSLAVAVTAGLTKRQFDQTMALHPSAAEEFVTLREARPSPQ
jgi:glutathione reductase (NADPH)